MRRFDDDPLDDLFKKTWRISLLTGAVSVLIGVALFVLIVAAIVKLLGA